MTILTRIYREPAKLLAFATAILAVLVGTGVLTATGSTIALAVVAGAIGLLSYIVTPAGEVVAQQLPGGAVIAGAAADVATGHPVDVDVQPIDTDLQPPKPRPTLPDPGRRRRDDTGASDLEAVVVCVGLIFVAAVMMMLLVR